jgi:hypothetical protein
MIIIDDKIVSEELKDKHFVCNLSACKGACCVEGDSGAPLDFDELDVMENIYEKVKSYITQEGIAAIENQGHFILDNEDGVMKTPLIEGTGACAYVNYKNGTAYCGIERAWIDKKIDFRKPVSCHLYPVRITKHKDFEAVNYERWDICNPACSQGDELKVPIYKFVKEALIRKYGEDFYAALEASIKFSEEKK